MPDDTLLINRQAELPDLVSRVLYGHSYQDLILLERRSQKADVDLLLTALGVGKPDPVTARHLSLGAGAIRFLTGETVRWIEQPDEREAADRIERAIGSGDED